MFFLFLLLFPYYSILYFFFLEMGCINSTNTHPPSPSLFLDNLFNLTTDYFSPLDPLFTLADQADQGVYLTTLGDEDAPQKYYQKILKKICENRALKGVFKGLQPSVAVAVVELILEFLADSDSPLLPCTLTYGVFRQFQKSPGNLLDDFQERLLTLPWEHARFVERVLTHLGGMGPLCPIKWSFLIFGRVKTPYSQLKKLTKKLLSIYGPTPTVTSSSSSATSSPSRSHLELKKSHHQASSPQLTTDNSPQLTTDNHHQEMIPLELQLEERVDPESAIWTWTPQILPAPILSLLPITALFLFVQIGTFKYSFFDFDTSFFSGSLVTSITKVVIRGVVTNTNSYISMDTLRTITRTTSSHIQSVPLEHINNTFRTHAHGFHNANTSVYEHYTSEDQ